MKKTSMLYWWPRVKDLGIPVPKTVIIEMPEDDLAGLLDDKWLSLEDERRLIKAGEKVGYPLFLRTDMASAKHQWERTCFVPKFEELFKHVWALIDATLAASMFGELDPSALVFRELLRLNSFFTAFSGLPISAERRYFVRDGVVECHHPYWTQDAIKRPSKSDWKERLATLNKESAEEIELLTKYATRVGEVLEGYWSIDFAEARDHSWYLIDLAVGERSWHPEH